MDPLDANRVQTFNNEVVLPAFINLKTELETSEKNIAIVRNTENIPEAVAAVVRQMHPETPYLGSNLSPSSPPQSWIVASLYVEILQQLATDSICIGQYCLSIEIKINPSAQIQISSIVGYTQATDKPLKTHHREFENNHQHLALENIDDSDITLHFIESFDGFESYRLESESPPTAVEQTSNLRKPTSEPESSPAAPLPKAPSIPQSPIPQSPIPKSTFAEIEAARNKNGINQRQETETLLSYLKLKKTSFRHLWTPDLERGAALAQKIVNHRPDQTTEYQQAYDLLAQQATEFAWSLKPNMLSEFADYFELYWTMADRASIFTATQENRPYPETFITQVHALGEPENLRQAKATISNPLRSLVRSIALKLGRPDERGNRDWIGFGSMHSTEPVERMPRMIQVLNDQRRVLFETLSWGILQVYQNAEQLPPIEQKLGRNPVISYLISARLTIQKPTQAVESNTSNVEDYEFRFKRLIENGSQSWIATAQVQVSRGRRVNLYRYEIEAC